MSPRDRFSLVGHSALPFMNPLGEDELGALLDPLGLDGPVLDLGAGRGDLAWLVATRWGCPVTCVDASPAACEVARERTRGLPVEVHALKAEDYLRTFAPRGLSLVAVLGALHAFGPGIGGFRSAYAQLRAVTRHVLFADAVALGPHAEREFEVATRADVERTFAKGIVSRVDLGPERVAAYERAWCDGLSRYLAAHPDDPRADWARERLAWSTSPKMTKARGELGFAAFVVHTALEL